MINRVSLDWIRRVIWISGLFAHPYFLPFIYGTLCKSTCDATFYVVHLWYSGFLLKLVYGFRLLVNTVEWSEDVFGSQDIRRIFG